MQRLDARSVICHIISVFESHAPMGVLQTSSILSWNEDVLTPGPPLESRKITGVYPPCVKIKIIRIYCQEVGTLPTHALPAVSRGTHPPGSNIQPSIEYPFPLPFISRNNLKQ